MNHKPKKVFTIPQGSCLARADMLIQELLKLLRQESPTADVFHHLADRLQIPSEPKARIYFFTQLYQQVHDLPLRLFKASDDRREELLYAVQDALDTAIISEE